MGKRYPPIADYGLIGDCHTAALIARDASIDWYCPGRFDAPAVFCRVLDADKGGYPRSEGYDVGSSRRILRHLEGLQGEVELTIEFKPTFDYVRAHTRVETCSAGGAIARADGQYLTLGSAEI